MTQDILAQTGETPYLRINEAAKNQLQQLCQVAQTSQGSALLEVIKQALDAPGIYVFGELLVLPNVQAVNFSLSFFLKIIHLLIRLSICCS